MPRRITMGTLVTRCKQRADQENSSHISDSEWKSLLSEQYGEVWSVVADTGYRYFETTTTVTATGAASYTEPTGHLSTLQVTRVDSSDHEHPLDELMHQDEPHFKGLTGDARYWTLVDDQLFLYPNPSSGSYKWYYLQQPTDLSAYADGDVVDVVAPAGESFLIWGVLVKALAKSEANAQLAMAERDRYRDELQFWASQRAIGESRRRVSMDDPDRLAFDPVAWRWP